MNLPAARVSRARGRIAAWRGHPARLGRDNSPEFVTTALAEWAEAKGGELILVQPGRPMQNGCIERSNGSNRQGVLDLYVFRTLSAAREQTERWPADDNEQIPHDPLQDLTAVE